MSVRNSVIFIVFEAAYVIRYVVHNKLCCICYGYGTRYNTGIVTYVRARYPVQHGYRYENTAIFKSKGYVNKTMSLVIYSMRSTRMLAFNYVFVKKIAYESTCVFVHDGTLQGFFFLLLCELFLKAVIHFIVCSSCYLFVLIFAGLC